MSLVGVVGILPLYFISVEHIRLQGRFGEERGRKIGDAAGMVSGWGFFLFWIGVWVSPQPRFTAPFLSSPVRVPLLGLPVPTSHLIVALVALSFGMWLGIKGVTEVTLMVAETHRTDKVVSTGVYSLVRHPQYLGGLLAHVGMSYLLSGLYAFLSTPLMVAVVYAISWKEEHELVREFGEEYEAYRREVPMFIPRLRESGTA